MGARWTRDASDMPTRATTRPTSMPALPQCLMETAGSATYMLLLSLIMITAILLAGALL